MYKKKIKWLFVLLKIFFLIFSISTKINTAKRKLIPSVKYFFISGKITRLVRDLHRTS